MQIIYYNLSETVTENVFFHKTMEGYKMDYNFGFPFTRICKVKKFSGNCQR